jgi:hypothetical protein
VSSHFPYRLILVLLFGVAWGCGSPVAPRLKLESAATGKLYSRDFSQAYFAPATNGEYDIVLIDEESPAPRGSSQKTLQPAQSAPLRQVVAIRVHWRPPHGTRADNPSASNAVLDWYVIGDTADRTQERLHYQGAAFVLVQRKGETAHVTIEKGTLALVDSVGSLSDPVGEARISGTFAARKNDTRVAAVTEPMKIESLARIRPAGAQQPPAPRSAAGQ